MRTITKTVFQFSELSEAAKEKARDWSIGPYCPIDYRVRFDNSNFRGVKLRDFTGEEMPTGYCLDCALWGTFHKVFKETGDCKYAFLDAVHTGFSEWRADMEWQLSDKYVDETIVCNEYEFYENGEIA